ncbi:MAG: hypothetical protein LBE83_08165 [Propionibacteriaceae bacterium]|jgi:hypothetical protein|nr:hypothetical protein [Propionibacteriaceae bacterium]
MTTQAVVSRTGVRWGTLTACYAVVHGLGEFLTALTLFSMTSSWTDLALLIVVYNALAFGCPLLIASFLVASRIERISEGQMGLAGAVLMATGMMVAQLPWACVVLLGLGSAMLHIAAGTATLKLGSRKGTAVGVFESTGAFGLALGGVLGLGVWHQVAATPWIGLGALVMVIGGGAVLAWGTPAVGAIAADVPSTSGFPAFARTELALAPRPGWALLGAVGLLALISVVRATIGLTAPSPWKEGTALILVAALAVALGRAVGGIITDRWGYRLPALVGLLSVGIFLGLFPTALGAGLVGCFLLGCTMAPLIVALVDTIGRPSLAFGMAQFCQVPAAILVGLVYPSWVIIVLMAICALLLLAVKPLSDRRINAPL